MNLYILFAFDLWIETWRKKVAKGKVMAIRYADDLVVGFEHRDEAERFLKEFGLSGACRPFSFFLSMFTPPSVD